MNIYAIILGVAWLPICVAVTLMLYFCNCCPCCKYKPEEDINNLPPKEFYKPEPVPHWFNSDVEGQNDCSRRFKHLKKNAELFKRARSPDERISFKTPRIEIGSIATVLNHKDNDKLFSKGNQVYSKNVQHMQPRKRNLSTQTK